MESEYALVFSQRHPDFCHAEAEAKLHERLPPPLCWRYEPPTCSKWPVARVYVRPAEAEAGGRAELQQHSIIGEAASRCLLVKCCLHVWAQGDSYDALHRTLADNAQGYHHCFANAADTYCVRVRSIGKKVHADYALQRIHELSYLPIDEGRVDLRNATHELAFVELYESASDAQPRHVLFGRVLAVGMGHCVHTYNLQERPYIGNTSMDPLLALLQANLCNVQRGSLVLDPFAGTGGILLGAAHFGALCVGADLSYKVACGIGKSSRVHAGYMRGETTMRTNFEHYGVGAQLAGVLVADASLMHLALRPSTRFDAILCDPPYGVREKTAKVGRRCRPDGWIVKPPPQEPHEHYPEKTKYGLDSVFVDLLNLSAAFLRLGGRLSYWYPTAAGAHGSDGCKLPSHPCLELVANCEQPLSGKAARRLVIMRKVKEPSGDADVAQCSEYARDKRTFRHLVLPQ